MLRVAHHRRTDARRLYTRASFAWLCVEFAMLVTVERERARLRARERRAERLDLAALVGAGVNDGKILQREFDREAARRAAEDAPPSEAAGPGAGWALVAEAIAAHRVRADAGEPVPPEVH